VQRKKSRGIDYGGLSLITIGLGCLQVMMDRGEDDDWFGSNFIRLMALLAFLGIFGAIGWLLIAKRPIVNLMVFKDRNFSVGCMLIAAASVIVYASAVAIPQFAQQVLPYTATWAGLVLSPGGIALMVLVPVASALVEIVQPRYVIALGFLILGCGLVYTNFITPDIDFRTLVMMRTIQSAGFGFLLVPINTVAFLTLPRKLNNDGAALFAMFRNVSGSIGISLATAAITERTQVHQSYLSQWVTPLNQPFQTLIASYEQTLRAMGRAGVAVHDIAVGQAFQAYRIQAAVLAYADIFMYAAIMAFIMIPLSFLVSRRKCGRETIPHAGVRH
jgi:DHA2 family multidrug resistance protein